MRRLAVLCALVVAAASTHAQQWPSRSIRVVVNFPPGGAADQIARGVAPPLGEALGQPVVVENRPGASGNIGAEAVAKSAPDGYTLLMSSGGAFSVNPHLYTRLPFDPLKDLVPVAAAARILVFLVVKPELPAKSVEEFVALARASPGRLSYGSPGSGSSPHIAGEMFKRAARIDVVHVPYKGAAPANQDLMGGHVMMMFDIAPFALPNMRAGKVRALAVATAERLPVAPQLPTMAEAGMPEVQGGAWFALFAPAGTPRPVVEWWNKEARRVFSEAETRERFESQGAVLPMGTPEALGAFVAADSQRWGRVIRTAGIKLE
jgi:tripartite-type tricarboxylate transporter receptor subunit TctC